VSEPTIAARDEALAHEALAHEAKTRDAKADEAAAGDDSVLRSIDAAVVGLQALAQLPPADAVASFDDLHRRLQDALADLDQA